MTSVPAQRADAEAILLGPRLSALRLLHDEGVVSDPDVCTAYVIVWLEARHGPGKWLGGKRKLAPALTRSGAVCEGDSYKSIDFDSLVAGGVLHPPPVKSLQRLRLHEASTLREALERAQFLTLPEYAAVSLLNWYAGFRPLRLLWRIPSADELLDMQAVGERCVSALTSDKALRTTFGHRDCMEMLVHDLQHAERFMGGDQYWQQVGFFAFLRSSVAPLHATHLADSCGQRWRLAWQYVSSDMNAAAVHLLMTLKCQLAGAIARRTLQEQGLDVPGEAEEDIKLAAMKGDIYPKAVAGPWREALRSAGLVDAYMTAFARVERRGLGAHGRGLTAFSRSI